jgi:hypothetical protein
VIPVQHRPVAHAPEDLAGAGIVQGHARGPLVPDAAFILVRAVNLKPGPVRVHPGDVQRIAVAQARGKQPLAVIIYDHRAIDDFVFPVVIDVGDHNRVCAHAGIAIDIARCWPVMFSSTVRTLPGRDRPSSFFDAVAVPDHPRAQLRLRQEPVLSVILFRPTAGSTVALSVM